MPSIIGMQQALARKALYQPYSRFSDIYGLVRDESWLSAALFSILQHEGAAVPGIDGVTKTHLDSDTKRARLVAAIARQLREGTYRPSPVRRVCVPKADGRLRPVGIPTITDRMVQESLRMTLEPIYEGRFLPCSFGFRPRQSTMDVIRQLTTLMNAQGHYYWVMSGDIDGCFDNIPHGKLLETIAETIDDRRVIQLIRLMLVAGYEENGRIRTPNCGTSQGGVISPLLANIYLHQMDQERMEKLGESGDLSHYHGTGHSLLPVLSGGMGASVPE